MHAKLIVIVGYLAAIAAIAVFARRRSRPGAEDFFLAGRTLGPIILLATMAATNFSGFTVVGVSGAGYRLGFAFYPIIAFGTGFMALSFVIIGIPVRRAGLHFGLVTPAELLGARFGNRPLTVLFAVVMTVFTLPYLAIQPMAAGYALEGLVGVPYQVGAVLTTALVLAYVLAGGLRSVVWTDVMQGGLMFVVLAVGFVVIARASGGMSASFGTLARQTPALFSRPGDGGGLLLGIWVSYMLLWLLADPMFPQLFQRFYAAGSERSLLLTMIAYPVVTTVLFFFPVAIGVLGRLHVPGLAVSESDKILPLLVERFGGSWLAGLACAGLIAGIMSTMDSQLLTLGSIVERDVLGRSSDRRGSRPGQEVGAAPLPGGRARRLVLAALALAGLALALKPPATILAVATEAFAGLAVLMPAVVATLYWRRASAGGVTASILVGEAMVVLGHFGLVPRFGLLPAIPAVVAASVAVLVAGLASPGSEHNVWARWREAVGPGLPVRKAIGWAIVFGVFGLLAVDWWRFGRAPRLTLGLPGWLWYFVVLGFLLSAAFLLFGRDVSGSAESRPHCSRRSDGTQRDRRV